ncbi:cyclic lactone autoinducer peptide [Paenibacillus cisolokensis]|uniref:AgrD family cyclic lactone autoinducer peptide n=1 Tax=Paenibacillus cisolokensis TaxID=1658519 RepID=UPI003D2BB7BC
MVNFARKFNHSVMSALASAIASIAVLSVSTASILFVYKGEVPEELLRKEE